MHIFCWKWWLHTHAHNRASCCRVVSTSVMKWLLLFTRNSTGEYLLFTVSRIFFSRITSHRSINRICSIYVMDWLHTLSVLITSVRISLIIVILLSQLFYRLNSISREIPGGQGVCCMIFEARILICHFVHRVGKEALMQFRVSRWFGVLSNTEHIFVHPLSPEYSQKYIVCKISWLRQHIYMNSMLGGLSVHRLIKEFEPVTAIGGAAS